MLKQFEKYKEVYVRTTAYILNIKRFDTIQEKRYLEKAEKLFNYIIDTCAQRSFEHNKALIITNCIRNAVYYAYKVPKEEKAQDQYDDTIGVEPAVGYDTLVNNPEEILILREEVERKARICKEQKRLLSRYLNRLSAEKRKIVRLKVHKEMPYQKIAEKFDFSWATVRRRYESAIAELKDHYLEIDEQTMAEKIEEITS